MGDLRKRIACTSLPVLTLPRLFLRGGWLSTTSLSSLTWIVLYLYFILDDYQVIQTDMLFHSNSKGYKIDQYIGPAQRGIESYHKMLSQNNKLKINRGVEEISCQYLAIIFYLALQSRKEGDRSNSNKSFSFFYILAVQKPFKNLLWRLISHKGWSWIWIFAFCCQIMQFFPAATLDRFRLCSFSQEHFLIDFLHFRDLHSLLFLRHVPRSKA